MSEINLINGIVDRALQLIWKLLFPIVIKICLVILFIGIVFMLVVAAIAEQNKGKAREIVNAAYKFDLPSIEEKFVTINGKKYALPIKEGLSKTETLMLMGIRVPEFGTRLNSSLDGDRDSFCPYQQRASELYTVPYLEAKTREIVGDYFDKIFMEQRRQFINQYKDIQIRKVYYPVTQRYGVAHGWTGQHYGIDYGYNFGNLVSSSMSGEVLGIKNPITKQIEMPVDALGGQLVIIYNEKTNTRQIFAHLSKPLVRVGQKVGVGEVIAFSGNSGIATTAPHLHYQLNKGKEGDIRIDSIDPDSQPFLTQLQSSQFYAISAQLVDIHLKTGLCDSLALERLKKEPSTKNWVDRPNIDKDELNNLVKALCLSQRPIDCGVWESNSLTILREIYDQI